MHNTPPAHKYRRRAAHCSGVRPVVDAAKSAWTMLSRPRRYHLVQECKECLVSLHGGQSACRAKVQPRLPAGKGGVVETEARPGDKNPLERVPVGVGGERETVDGSRWRRAGGGGSVRLQSQDRHKVARRSRQRTVKCGTAQPKSVCRADYRFARSINTCFFCSPFLRRRMSETKRGGSHANAAKRQNTK